MTGVMAQQTLALSPPASRQDVISAPLSDYGTSFGHELYANKQLPPPPLPRAAVRRMAMKFQLRDENIPPSPNGSRKSSSEQRARKRIVSRSLSREGKPASLRLVVSNGSTASVPLTPAVSAPTQPLASPGPFENKYLPPPPPEKSVKRKSTNQAVMGNQQSANAKDLTRNDSLLSQNEGKASTDVLSNVSPIVTRKALPMAAVRKMKSLAELGKASPSPRRDLMPTTSAPRKASVDADLPFNSRAKTPPSPLHLRGKSSTGFNIFKMSKSSPTVPIVLVNTITPDMTPSPTLRPDMALNDMQISPASPLPPPLHQYRPFSFEATNEPPKGSFEQPMRPATATAALSTPTLLAKAQSPRQDKSFRNAAPNSETRPSTGNAQLGHQLPHSPPSSSPRSPVLENPTPPPPFVPLTRQCIPRPESAIPPISSSQLQCYTSHRTNIWSNNVFQPTGCQICHDNARDQKWVCVWCQLRICRACSEELRVAPGRSVGALLKPRREEVTTVQTPAKPPSNNPGIVISSVDEGELGNYVDGF